MYTSIAAYKFAPLHGLTELREQLRATCAQCDLKGTILLSPEGINLFIAGTKQRIDVLLAELRSIVGLEDLAYKESESEEMPFRRMLVKLKKEIIAFGVEGIAPRGKTSTRLSAHTLKQWIDEGKPLTLLDTRNDYEIRMGTFKNALAIGVSHFRDFPEATRKLPEALKNETVVMFCTGGIRCEKAGPFMEREGYSHIYQLDGGILKYFEECGSAHYDGDCFVFDRRVCVDPQLHETGAELCFNCQLPLTPSEQADPRYVVGESCPYCHTSS
ncbi:MAG: rhodanese-like domain-containing protein [Planctomycetota bacterium]|nr:rhodanese-like domain-containing protein [Planctomycetota bacterium]